MVPWIRYSAPDSLAISSKTRINSSPITLRFVSGSTMPLSFFMKRSCTLATMNLIGYFWNVSRICSGSPSRMNPWSRKTAVNFSPTKILQRIGRNTTPQEVETAFKLCRKNGIKTACSFMLGLPDETLKYMEDSLKFAKKLSPDWCQFNTFIAYPDSRIYNELHEKGNYVKLDEFLLSVKTDEFDYNSLMAVQRRFFKEFHMTPKQIMKRVRREGAINFAKRRLMGGTRKSTGIA